MRRISECNWEGCKSFTVCFVKSDGYSGAESVFRSPRRAIIAISGCFSRISVNKPRELESDMPKLDTTMSTGKRFSTLSASSEVEALRSLQPQSVAIARYNSGVDFSGWTIRMASAGASDSWTSGAVIVAAQDQRKRLFRSEPRSRVVFERFSGKLAAIIAVRASEHIPYKI